jgi:hypothetical protein
MMEKDKLPSTHLLWAAVLAVASSPVPAVLSQLLEVSRDTATGLFFLTFSLLAFGIAEFVNHPAHSGNRYTHDDEPDKFNRFSQRRRVPSGLGNLLFICAILLFCMAMAKIFLV